MARTKKNSTVKRNDRPKQAFILDTGPVSIPEIDVAAEAYVDARDARMRKTKDEIAASAVLLATMKSHDLRQYEYEGKVVRVTGIEKVKVKRAEQESASIVDVFEDNE